MIDDIAAAITHVTGENFRPAQQASVGGGCISQAFKLSDGARSFFIKTNRAERLPMFEAEAAGLEEITGSESLRAPRPVCSGTSGGSAWLALEYLELGGSGSGAEMGSRLAQMHRKTAACFGWTRDNTIGSTPQINTWNPDWLAFLREHRLGFQLRLAARNGYGGGLQTLGEKLLARLEDFFPGYQPRPSLLHGDLWGGNAAFAVSGEPVVFDPAVYYGDREADLAMTELFGGFGAGFYAAYREAWPLDPGYAVRKTLYNLYHILNHANLFGGAYAGQAEAMMQRLLAELK